ncbi:hypothetical protein Tco_1053973, partial [Tanacetum coccineum]
MTPEAIEELIAQCLAEALATYEANCNLKNIVESRDENDNDNRNGNGGGNRNGNGNNNNGSGNHDENARGARQAIRECTYKEFLNCQQLNFKGIDGAVGLARIVGTDAAYAMTWKELMKLMTEVYCLRNEIQNMENEIWNLLLRTMMLLVIPNDSKSWPFYAQKWFQMRRMRRLRGYVGTLPPCDKCKLHHHGPCPIKYGNCKKVDHQVRDGWTPTTVTCYGCGEKGHTK